MLLPHLDRDRRVLGLTLYLIAMTIGGLLLLLLFIIKPLFGPSPAQVYTTMLIGGVLAFPAGLVNLTLPRLLDRYDPEPLYTLFGCLAWGGIAACGFSATINTLFGSVAALFVGEQTASILSAVVCAPFVEEFWKGLGVWGIFRYVQREFDGMVDGIIYASFTAVGFATVENVIYYARAGLTSSDQLVLTVLGRAFLSPWCHPVFTAMTGLGLGLAREKVRRNTRWLCILGGYFCAVFLHAAWNGSASLAMLIGPAGGFLFILSLPLWFLFVVTFLVIIIFLVRRRGNIIRRFLQDEVAIGNLSPDDVALIGSAFGLFRARIRYGKVGAEFARTAARLALSKWHTVRAQEHDSKTLSADFIVPLRQRLAELRPLIHPRPSPS